MGMVDDVMKLAIPLLIFLILGLALYLILKKADMIIKGSVEILGRIYGVV